MSDRPRVLIEDWLPISQIGAESQRERGASSALPPLYFLHVWWARRPLTVSRAAILGSLLPAWSEEWPRRLLNLFPTRNSYHDWFLELLGILGDPAKGRKLLTAAREQNISITNPYGYSRAFTYNPTRQQIETVQELLRARWGVVDPVVMDCFAGGGSIPFESLRYGLTTIANELNPVAMVVLKATLDYPARFGKQLIPLVEKYGKRFSDAVRERLRPFYTDHGDTRDLVGACYLWARTVVCPYTGKPVPLCPNWWLLKGANPVAVQASFSSESEAARFRVVRGKEACRRTNPDKGTIKRGNAISPWAHDQVIDGDYIKAEAQAGRMGQQLFVVGLKRAGGFEFRAPTDADLLAIAAAGEAFRILQPEWIMQDILPTEPRRAGRADWAAEIYGFRTWADTYSPRQLLAFGIAVEEFRKVTKILADELEPNLREAVLTYLALAFDKALDYNSTQVGWDPTYKKIAHAFSRHDLGMKWTYAEFDAAYNLFPWALDQVGSALDGILQLINPGSRAALFGGATAGTLLLSQGNAASMGRVSTQSVDRIVTDPPYYDNVNYADCSDYFYVWLKRLLGGLFKEQFSDELTNKDDEAIANYDRFSGMGPKRALLAEQDYAHKMEACFREMHRVLRDDGVLTVMFTHKKVEAWDTLGASLINAGFAVHSSWPVHTESEHSLHQAKKNAAASTILLTCRKRTAEGTAVWWDDLKSKVREKAREKAHEYQKLGIGGVDLYIATFGPVLSVISERWPVLTSEVDAKTNKPKPLRPEAALEIAREEVVSLRKRGLLLGREVRFDPVTDWYLLAWDAFRAEQFPADEARKLCIALDIELEQTVIASKKLVTKKGKNVSLNLPKARRKRGMVDPDLKVFDSVLDAVHTAMLVFEEDGARACERWMRERGLDRDQRVRALVQAMANAIPITKTKGTFIRPELALLDRMNDALGLGITFPVEPEPDLQPRQTTFLTPGHRDGGGDAEEKEGDLSDEDEDDA